MSILVFDLTSFLPEQLRMLRHRQRIGSKFTNTNNITGDFVEANIDHSEYTLVRYILMAFKKGENMTSTILRRAGLYFT